MMGNSEPVLISLSKIAPKKVIYINLHQNLKRMETEAYKPELNILKKFRF